MSEAQKTQTHNFQTEAKQLLHLMIHSLYSNKEIFLRELISNASDAIDKLRFKAIENPQLIEDDSDYHIDIDFDKEAKTLTVSDNGIGMSYDEVVSNLGTIAKSGTAEFLGNLTGDQQSDSQLIGQFGVGFYSVFMVANEVEVFTRGADQKEGVRWLSSGEDSYEIEMTNDLTRGTKILLHLKEDCLDFAEDFRLRSIVRKYSDHIGVPVRMPKQNFEQSDDEDKKDLSDELELEAVNSARALWTRSRSDVKDEEYNEEGSASDPYSTAPSANPEPYRNRTDVSCKFLGDFYAGSWWN